MKIKLLNDLYESCCEPECGSYLKFSDDIFLIKNFFKNFDLARNFFLSRDKWQCIPYQGYSKSGYESIFPFWVGKSLLEKFILDNKIIDDSDSYGIVCNFFYNELGPVWSLSHSNYYPHIDFTEENGALEYICLVNLNLSTVSTNFFSYKDKHYCGGQNERNEWDAFTEKRRQELFEHYNKTDVTRNEVKEFLNSKNHKDLKLIKNLEYGPNQAIVYPGNLFHSPNITEEFTEDNPRALLRIVFTRKVSIKYNYS